MIFGYWFKKDNFGIHMRNERNKNWKTTTLNFHLMIKKKDNFGNFFL